MENRAHALIAGVFALCLGTVGVLMLWWFSGQHEGRQALLVTTERNVTGLNLQAQVRYRGIRVGRVESIDFDRADPRRTLIALSIRKDVPITRGTTARLAYQGITGLAHVLLEDSGKDSAPLAAVGEGVPRIAMQDSFVQEMADVGADALRQTRDLIGNVNLLLSADNRRALGNSLANLEATTANAREATARLNAVLSAENVRRIEASLQHVERATAQAGPLLGETRSLVRRLDTVGEKIDAALGDSTSGGVVTLLPRLNELSVELSTGAHHLSRVLLMLERSPQSLIFGFQPAPPGPGETGFVAPGAKETP